MRSLEVGLVALALAATAVGCSGGGASVGADELRVTFRSTPEEHRACRITEYEIARGEHTAVVPPTS